MAKANVNTASRDELVEAGVRDELADEILKLRRKSKISLEALNALPGVGPVTLEQLRTNLDFQEGREGQHRRGSGNGGAPTRPGERGSKEAPERTAETARSAVRGGAEAAQATVKTSIKAAPRAARRDLPMVQRAADTTGEVQRAIVQQLAASTSELSQILMDVVKEQNRHNLETLTALTRAVRWDEILQAQSAFLRVSLERMAEVGRCYAEMSQAVLTSASRAGQDRRERAA
jgi:DNA-binding FrmR family transcriptional regulator